jgi:hypothetical protein
VKQHTPLTMVITGPETCRVVVDVGHEIRMVKPGTTKEAALKTVQTLLYASCCVYNLINKIMKPSTQQFLHNKHSYNESCHYLTPQHVSVYLTIIRWYSLC